MRALHLALAGITPESDLYHVPESLPDAITHIFANSDNPHSSHSHNAAAVLDSVEGGNHRNTARTENSRHVEWNCYKRTAAVALEELRGESVRISGHGRKNLIGLRRKEVTSVSRRIKSSGRDNQSLAFAA